VTNAELAILSLIAEKPRHGYDIEQVIETRGMRDWTEIGFSSIYYILRKLEKDGLVTSQVTPAEGRGPARKVYQITSKGKAAFLQAGLDAIRFAESPNTGLLMGMSLLPALPQDEALQALNSLREKLADRIRALKDQVDNQQPMPPHVVAMFDYSLTLAQTEYNWLEGFISQFGKPG